MFGPHDNYNLESSHVIPGLIRKLHDIIQKGKSIYNNSNVNLSINIMMNIRNNKLSQVVYSSFTKL